MNLEQVRADLEMCRSGQETITKIWALDHDVQNKIFVLRWWSASQLEIVGIDRRLFCRSTVGSFADQPSETNICEKITKQ
jgi:hypothetical protein